MNFSLNPVLPAEHDEVMEGVSSKSDTSFHVGYGHTQTSPSTLSRLFFFFTPFSSLLERERPVSAYLNHHTLPLCMCVCVL